MALIRPQHDFEPGPLNRCQVCGSSDLDLVIDLGHQPLCDSLLSRDQLVQPETTYPLRLMRCTDCGLVQIDYVVAGQVVYHRSYPYRTGITKELSDHHHRLSVDVVRRHNTPVDSLVVDIGSNDGTLLKGFQRQGMRVLGIEPTDIAKFAREAGIETIQAFFDEEIARQVVESHGQAKLITATNVFAHMASLGAVLRAVEKLLAPDGLFVIENHYLGDIISNVQYDTAYHEHLRTYSIQSLIRLFSFYDMSVVDAQRVASYGGSIRIFVARGGNLPMSRSLTDLLAEEIGAGLYKSETYAAFRKNVSKHKADLLKLAITAAEQGKRFVGNSCPGRCSTLLNYVGIDRELMPYIAEQPTSLKLGLYLPGKHIPVVENSVLVEEQPDYVVLLAWHYWQTILAGLRARGVRSKFILPLPEVQVIEN